MIDLHSHVLPGVDDGAVSVPMALEMLDIACRDGTDTLVMTPHYGVELGYDNPGEKIRDLFEQFCAIVERERIPIDLYLGCEYLMADPDRFRENWRHIQTINGSHYLLMEFFFEVSEREILKGIDAVREKGLTPIIAHPERYDCIKVHPSFGEQIARWGGLLQMNKGSPLGAYGRHAREAAMELLDRRLYSFAGSDTHRPVGRDPRMSEAVACVRRYFGEAYCYRIFEENPDRVLRDERLKEVEAYEEY